MVMGPVFTPKWIVPFQLMTKLHRLEEDKSKIACVRGGRILNAKASFSFHVVTKQSQFKFEPWDAYFLCHFMLGSKWRKSPVISSFLQNFTENWGGLAWSHLIIPLLLNPGGGDTPPRAQAVIQFKCRLP